MKKIDIISKFPKGFKYSHHKGLPLDTGWYCLFYDDEIEKWILRTATNEPYIKELRKHFNIEYEKDFWGHWSDYIIEELEKQNKE